MDIRVKKIWVKALRSGDYKQGKHALKKDDCFCCLGVLCDLYGKEKDQHWSNESNEEGERAFMGNAKLPSRQVAEWSGISSDCFDPTIIKIGQRESSLAGHNDGGLVNFEDIADAIERDL